MITYWVHTDAGIAKFNRSDCLSDFYNFIDACYRCPDISSIERAWLKGYLPTFSFNRRIRTNCVEFRELHNASCIGQIVSGFEGFKTYEIRTNYGSNTASFNIGDTEIYPALFLFNILRFNSEYRCPVVQAINTNAELTVNEKIFSYMLLNCAQLSPVLGSSDRTLPEDIPLFLPPTVGKSNHLINFFSEGVPKCVVKDILNSNKLAEAFSYWSCPMSHWNKRNFNTARVTETPILSAYYTPRVKIHALKCIEIPSMPSPINKTKYKQFIDDIRREVQ